MKKKTFDDSCFSSIESEAQVYWLGFLMAENKITGNIKVPVKIKHSKAFLLGFGGNQQTHKFYCWLYNNSTIYLERKKIVFEKVFMPTYEYACSACDEGFEVVQSIREDALVTCPSCHENKLRRVLHAVHVFARGEPKTIAQQADRNMASMGTYELEDKRHKHEESAKRGRKDIPKPERPFWRNTDKVDTRLADLAPKTKIEKGKIVESEPLSAKAMDYIVNGKV